MPLVTPLFEASRALLIGFALGGALGLAAAIFGNRFRTAQKTGVLPILAGATAFLLAPILGAHPVIAAAAAGLLWGEQSIALVTTRVRLRRLVERNVAPIAYFAFGALLAPRILQADLLSIVFALAAVTVMRAGPRLVSLNKTTLPKESQMFLAWFARRARRRVRSVFDFTFRCEVNRRSGRRTYCRRPCHCLWRPSPRASPPGRWSRISLKKPPSPKSGRCLRVDKVYLPLYFTAQ